MALLWYLRSLRRKILARQLCSFLYWHERWLPMDKEYAIFDQDGTLIDSMIFRKSLASEYLNNKDVKQTPGDMPERIKPMTMSESAALLRQEFGLTGNPEAEMNAMMDAHYKTTFL